MASYKQSYKGIGELIASEQLAAGLGKLADIVKTAAVAAAPVEFGDFKSSFETSHGVNGKRAYGRVTNTDDAALWIELGTKDTPKHRTLGKALDVLNAD